VYCLFMFDFWKSQWLDWKGSTIEDITGEVYFMIIFFVM